MRKNKIGSWIIYGIIIAVLLVGGWYFMNANQKPGKLDAFASCIKDSGATFYGAFWCPHCQNQKAMFGNSARLLPYVECSAPDAQSQLPLCTQKGVQGYPTWEFKDGSRQTGEVPLETLAQKTGCVLPK